MLSDIEIAQKNEMRHILDIAKIIDIAEEDLDLYGKYKAKITFSVLKELQKLKPGNFYCTSF